MRYSLGQRVYRVVWTGTLPAVEMQVVSRIKQSWFWVTNHDKAWHGDWCDTTEGAIHFAVTRLLMFVKQHDIFEDWEAVEAKLLNLGTIYQQSASSSTDVTKGRN